MQLGLWEERKTGYSIKLMQYVSDVLFIENERELQKEVDKLQGGHKCRIIRVYVCTGKVRVKKREADMMTKTP